MKKLVCALGALLLAACALTPDEPLELDEIPLKPVPYVDMDRYLGRWHLIANIPYFAERGNVAAYVEYRRLEDGTIEDIFSAQDGFDGARFTKNGQIEVFDPTTNAEGRITFFPFPGQDYAVLYLDPQYRYTLIGHPSRNFCWLFARAPEMPDAVYAEMLQVLQDNRFDIRRVLKIPQRREQAGAAGFQ